MPIEAKAAVTQLDEDVYTEMETARAALARLFASKGLMAVFMVWRATRRAICIVQWLLGVVTGSGNGNGVVARQSPYHR